MLAEIVPFDQMTAAAQWLDTVFENFDYKILEFYHNLHAGSAGGFFDFFFKNFTLLGEDGIFLLVLAVIFILFKKTRKVGLGMLFGIGFGAVFTNLTIKEIVARPRPYCTNMTYYGWWESVRPFVESEFSFPSGHTTAAAGAMLPVFLNGKKKVSWLAFVFIIVMGASRNYLMVHFPTDIIGGIIVGSVAGILSYLLFNFLYNKIFPKNKLGKVITEFDLIGIFRKNKG